MITGRDSISRDYLVYVIGVMVALVVTAGSANGQFIVQPMLLELTASPGQRYMHDIELANHDPNNTMLVGLTVVDLSQWEDGSWRAIDPNSDDVDISKLNSCKSWINLSQDTVNMEPLDLLPLKFTFQVPRGVYGFYSAGIIVSVMGFGEIEEVGLIIQFVVPVLVRVPGRVVQQKVELTDVWMGPRAANEKSPATTLVSMTVANRGGTYSRLMGRIRIWGFFKEHWRRITDREVRAVGILPGSELRLESDIERSLPPGRYKLWGGFYVDGRRIKPIQKVIDFAGDPSSTKISTDAAIELLPRDIIIDGLPSATRTAVLQVVNASDEEVDVKMKMALPRELMGVAFGSLKGEYLDCTSWLDIMPKEFKLSSYSKQNVRIIAKMPNPEAMFPGYYAVIGLFATYPDGLNAGTTIANVCVMNREVTTPLVAQPSGPVRLALQAGSKYLITSGFTNIGYIHFTPKGCLARVTNIEGGAMSQSVLYSSDKRGLMLPLESRNFSGEIDFTDYPAGLYRVEVSLDCGSSELPVIAINQIGVQVSIKGAKRNIEIVGREEFEKVGVKWR